jgi:hypothetical protein
MTESTWLRGIQVKYTAAGAKKPEIAVFYG